MWRALWLAGLLATTVGGRSLWGSESGSEQSGPKERLSDLSCESYDPVKCNPADEPGCDYVEQCKVHPSMKAACMAVWTNTSEPTIMLKSCWTAQEHVFCAKDECVATEPNRHDSLDGLETYFCCCEGNMCNKDVYWRPKPEASTPASFLEDDPGAESDDPTPTIVGILVGLAVFAVLLCCCYAVYRRRQSRLSQKHQLGTDSASFLGSGKVPIDSSVPWRSIQLYHEVARGRYGKVWQARMEEQLVAVKVFPKQDADSWMQEQDIYGINSIRAHPNILQLLCTEIRGGASPESQEYWLVTAFCQKGSLFDYLKTHAVTEAECLKIALTMLTGLAFLHDEEMGGLEQKPTVVHRDLKSRNILLKDDLTACIADFGLAMKCEHGRTPEDTHGQVGTRRYMAPEVLEGATEFSAFAFKQIDVYAMALILWELMSRTRIGLEEPDPYKLPFEEEIGTHPSLSEMQELVANEKRRPIIKESWHKHKVLGVLAGTTEEMWDTEPEARISAGCAVERLRNVDSRGVSEASPLMGRSERESDL